MSKFRVSKKALIPFIFGVFFFSLMIAMGIISPAMEEESSNITLFLTIAIIAVVIFNIVGIFIGWLYFKKLTFYDDGNNFVIEKGIIFKKQSKIPYENINTIAHKRSLLDLIFKTARIEIDSGTTASPLPEGNLRLSREYALYLKDFLESKKQNKALVLEGPDSFNQVEERDQTIIYQAKTSSLFVFGMFRPGVLIGIIIMAISSLSITYLGNFFAENPVESITLYTIIGLVPLSGLILLTSGISHMIAFYKYKLIIINDSLEYEYGLISRTNFKIKLNKINALYLKQSLMLRALNYYSLEASIIGIADIVQSDGNQNQSESKFLMPIGTKKELEEVLNLLDANELLETEFVRPTRLVKLNFIGIPLFFLTILLIAAIIFTYKYPVVLVSTVLIYLISLIALILRLKYHGYSTNKNLIVRRGSYTINKILVKRTKIQEMEFHQGPIKQLLRIGTVAINYKKVAGTVRLNGYTKDEFIDLKNNLL